MSQVGWEAVTADIKTAFLNAPKIEEKSLVLVTPPKIFQDVNILKKECEVWQVRRALYGLTTSLKDWTTHRVGWDELGRGRHPAPGEENSADLWKIVRLDQSTQDDITKEVKRMFITYVDDMLAVGDTNILHCFMAQLKKVWELGQEGWVKNASPW